MYTIAAVSFLLTCPNCGVREVTDFGFGGEVSVRTDSGLGAVVVEEAELDALGGLAEEREIRAFPIPVRAEGKGLPGANLQLRRARGPGARS